MANAASHTNHASHLDFSQKHSAYGVRGIRVAVRSGSMFCQVCVRYKNGKTLQSRQSSSFAAVEGWWVKKIAQHKKKQLCAPGASGRERGAGLVNSEG